MRSVWFTFVLLILALAVGGVSAVRFAKGNLDIIFVPAAKEGDRLYTFDAKDIYRIRLAANGANAECVFENGQWKILKPWSDRMDARAADAILLFTLGTRVIDSFPNQKLDSAQVGFEDGTTEVRIEDRAGKPLAKYRIGFQTPVKVYDEKNKIESPTIYVQPRDKNRKDYTYVCTGGDIHAVLKDGFRYLRDHHPLYFNPLALENIRIRNSDGELLLSRHDKDTPWRITKPLELRTDPAAVKKLLEDLFNLQAKRVSNRSEVTLPSIESGRGDLIALQHFGEKEETVMRIYPSEPESETVYATVSTRPDTVFELIRKPLSTAPGGGDDGIVSLANLPDTVNELRIQTLTTINGPNLQGILITPSSGDPIFLAREDQRSDFKVQVGNQMKSPNLDSLQKLLKAFTTEKVSGFVTDAATDLAPYGLVDPLLSVRFVFFNNEERLELIFGQGSDGAWYANRVGTPGVIKVDGSMISQIKYRYWDWKPSNLWSISPVDLKGIERTIEGTPKLSLTYNFASEQWTAAENNRDRSSEIDTFRAKHFFDLLINMRAAAWLGPDNPVAAKALARPVMQLDLLSSVVDEEGRPVSVEVRHLIIAPASDSPTNQIFFGKVTGEDCPFILSEGDVRNLSASLFGDN